MRAFNYVVLASSLVVLAACSKGGDNGGQPAPISPLTAQQLAMQNANGFNSIDIQQRRVLSRDFHASDSSMGQFSIGNDSCRPQNNNRSQHLRFNRVSNDLQLLFDGSGNLTVRSSNHLGTVQSPLLAPGAGYRVTNSGLSIDGFSADGAIDPRFSNSVLNSDGIYAKRFQQTRREFANVMNPNLSQTGGFNPDYVPGQPLVAPSQIGYAGFQQGSNGGLSARFEPMEIAIETSPSNPQHIVNLKVYNFRSHVLAQANDNTTGDGCDITFDSAVDRILFR